MNLNFDDFQKQDVKFDINKLQEAYKQILSIKDFSGPEGVSNFGAISLTQIPGDPDSIKGNKARGIFWTKPDGSGKEVLRDEKINPLVSKFELEPLQNIKAEFLSGGQKKRLVISLALLSNPKILLLDEPFAALDIMTIKNLQQIIVDLQAQHNISIILCDHQARDLLTCVDLAIVLSNGRVVAKDTPNNLIKNIDAQNAYFGDSFKIN